MIDEKDDRAAGATNNQQTGVAGGARAQGGELRRDETGGGAGFGGAAGGAYAQERAGAGAGAAMATGQVTAADRAFYSLGGAVAELVNKGIDRLKAAGTLKYPHGGREWLVVGFDIERGLQLQEPNKADSTAWVEFDENVMRAILPKILTL